MVSFFYLQQSSKSENMKMFLGALPSKAPTWGLTVYTPPLPTPTPNRPTPVPFIKLNLKFKIVIA